MSEDVGAMSDGQDEHDAAIVNPIAGSIAAPMG